MAGQSRHAGVQAAASAREIDPPRLFFPERMLHRWFSQGSAALRQVRKRQIPVAFTSAERYGRTTEPGHALFGSRF